MKPHPNRKKWNIIFLIYAELADAATQAIDPNETVNIKADLAELKSTILSIELADPFNVFIIENVVQIKDDVITSDFTYIKQLQFDLEIKKNNLKKLRRSRRKNFIQNSKYIEQTFRYIDKYYPAEKTLLVTWDHGSAFGIFKKTLSDHQVLPPVNEMGTVTETQLVQNMTFPVESGQIQILEQYQVENNDILMIVRNKSFQRANSFFEEKHSDQVHDESADFAILSSDMLACAIRKGFKSTYVDVLLMFNCYMQNMHTCYSLRDNVKYLIAPEGNISAPGYDYVAITKLIGKNEDTNGDEIAKIAVDTFKQNYERNNQNAAACDYIAVFAVCLINYTEKVVQPMKSFVSELEALMGKQPSLTANLRITRQQLHCTFASNLGYFLVDLNNFMQATEKLLDPLLDDLKKTLRNISNAISVGSAIGVSAYSSEPGTTTQNCPHSPTGFSIYFPPRLQNPKACVPKNFINPGAPYYTSLANKINWIEFLSKLYGK